VGRRPRRRSGRPGTAVGVTAGPLAAALAEQLAAVPALTVVTNCHAAATVLSRRRRTDQSMVLLGGTQTRGGSYTALTVAAAQLVSSTCSTSASPR
jgi:DeoR/GlpR family transcriptional regulator of sugar metabolism